jgi:hypothetical protein
VNCLSYERVCQCSFCQGELRCTSYGHHADRNRGLAYVSEVVHTWTESSVHLFMRWVQVVSWQNSRFRECQGVLIFTVHTCALCCAHFGQEGLFALDSRLPIDIHMHVDEHSKSASARHLPARLADSVRSVDETTPSLMTQWSAECHQSISVVTQWTAGMCMHISRLESKAKSPSPPGCE